MEWPNDLDIEMLDSYENEPSIRNPCAPRHKNRNNIQDSGRKIAHNPSINFTIADLKKKIMMSTFRKLASTVRDSKKTGSGVDEVLDPDHWP